MGVIERFGVKFHPARVHYNAFSGLILSSELHCTIDLVEKLVKYLKTIFIWYFYVQLSYVLKKYFLLVNRNPDSNQSLLLRPESELF